MVLASGGPGDLRVAVSDWIDRAACRERPTSWWFSGAQSLEAEMAIAICRSCRVRRACLDEAMVFEVSSYRFGIRGGLTVEQREQVAPSHQVA